MAKRQVKTLDIGELGSGRCRRCGQLIACFAANYIPQDGGSAHTHTGYCGNCRLK